MKTSSQVRQSFLDFYARRGHTPRPSAPLIPQGDPTLMFNSAGMVPFKPYFLGLKKDLSRATSCQKCFRTTDIERVGLTLRHLTFFEMLGNFSFGDYFKADAIAWAWELLTQELGFDPKRLHPTVFKDDNEAELLWKKQHILNPVTRLGEDSNFWSAGPTGPCGPCSEIYFDRGPEHSCGKPSCSVGCDCDRFLEIWNLVFMQFDRQPDGMLKPLPSQNIDTGAGLERVVFALQGKPSPFDTDLFSPIIEKASSLLGADPRRDEATARAFRVIADHSRAATMLMSEGVIPSNVDRGYVLRRLIRRALRYGQLLGHAQPFLYKLVPATVEIFKQGYPELADAARQVSSTLKAEEEKFLETLERGEAELGKLLAQSGRKLPGDKAFWLYETFGFPLELTKEICAQQGISLDETAFAQASERATEVARASWKGSGEKHFGALAALPKLSEFTGYGCLSEKTTVEAVESSALGCAIVIAKSPFYAEGGGQVGDTGWLLDAAGAVVAEVRDTQKVGANIMLLAAPGAKVSKGQAVLAKVDEGRRARIRPHHTGTHLLNEALKRVLGAHIRQAGSYVGPDKLRFDFTHPKPLSPDEILKIERIVNDEIAAAHPVQPKEHPIARVKEFGATTLLGENYGENPRFLLIGPKGWQEPLNRFSLELCGGTHVANTAEIAAFKIIKESSTAAGVRRIEAVAGPAVAEFEQRQAAEEKKRQEQRQARAKEQALAGLKAKKLASAGEAGRTLIEVKGVRLCAQRFEDADPKHLRSLSDKIKADVGSGLVFLAVAGGGKLSFVLAATPDLAAKGVDAARIAKAFASSQGGSAGGRVDFAQGGVADSDWNALLSGLTAVI